MDKIEKVKQGLRCIAQIGECDCDHCDYADNGHPSVLYKCQEKFASDALSVIEQMEHDIQSCIADLHHYQKDSEDIAKRWEKSKDYNVELQEEVKRLKAEHRWIPVSERLPEDEEDVLLYGERKGIVAGYRSEGTWYDYQHYHLTGRTHWMPLPQPPKEGDVDGNH